MRRILTGYGDNKYMKHRPVPLSRYFLSIWCIFTTEASKIIHRMSYKMLAARDRSLSQTLIVIEEKCHFTHDICCPTVYVFYGGEM